jgi:hypothetical protein
MVVRDHDDIADVHLVQPRQGRESLNGR